MMKNIGKIILGVLLLFIYPLGAAEMRSGEKVDVSKAVQDDLYGAGERIDVRGAVKGDASLAGGEIEVSSVITGDLNVIGGDVNISATVQDDLHVISGDVVISGNIQGDLFAIGGKIHIQEGAGVSGSVYLTGGDLRIDGKVAGSVNAYGGMIDIDGKVGGDLTVYGGETSINGTIGGTSTISSDELTIGEKAKFGGNVKYWASGDVDFGNSLAPGSEAIFDPDLEQKDKAPWEFGIFMLLLIFGSGAFSIFILNRFGGSFLKESSEYLRQNFVSAFGMGVLYVVLTPAAIFLMMMFVISIPFGIALCSLYCVSWVFAWPLVALLLTWWISEKSLTQWSPTRIFFSAFGIYVLLAFAVWIVFIGWLANMILISAAFGAIIQVMIRKTKTKRDVPQM